MPLKYLPPEFPVPLRLGTRPNTGNRRVGPLVFQLHSKTPGIAGIKPAERIKNLLGVELGGVADIPGPGIVTATNRLDDDFRSPAYMLLAQLPGAIGFQPPQADQHPGKELVGETFAQLPGLLAVNPTKALKESPGVLIPGPVIPHLPGALGLKPPQAHQHLVRNLLVQLVAKLPGVLRIAAANGQGDLLGGHIRELQPQLAGAGVFPHSRETTCNKNRHRVLELFAKIHGLF